MERDVLVKEQGITITSGSRILAVLWHVVDYIERNALDNGMDPSEYLFNSRDFYDILEGFSSDLPRNIKVYVSPFHGSESVELNDGTKIEFDRLEGEGEGYRFLMDKIYKVPFIYDKPILRKLSRKTSMNGIEYLFSYLSDGRLLYLEGEHFRVSVPFINQTITALHTHPLGGCMLSHADVESAIDSLINGAVLAGAFTEKCAIVLRRINIMVEDDFIELKKFVGFLKRRHDVRTIETKIYELRRKLVSVALESFYY